VRRQSHEPNRVDRVHARSQAWLRSQPFLARYVVLTILYAVALSAYAAILFAFGQSIDWSIVVVMCVVFPLFFAVMKGRPGDAHAWALRRFPRLYHYVDGFRHRPDPRLDRFKHPHDEN
jgi:hypothetical protein